jgi:hypothetical protein
LSHFYGVEAAPHRRAAPRCRKFDGADRRDTQAYDATVDEANIVGRIRWFCREL